MEHLFKKYFTIAALLSLAALEAAHSVTPTLVYRSQGKHADRQKMVGMVGHINRYDVESWYGTFDVAVGYMRSFRDDRIARALFGSDLNCNDCAPTILVQGSSVANRDPKAWLADYLYLPCDFSGSFSVKPRIQNVVVDLDLFVGLDEWVNGMYFRVYGPINWTKWQVNFCEASDATAPTASCATGYFTPSGDEVYLTSIASYFQGDAPASVDNVTFEGLKRAKIVCNCDDTKTGFADLRMELGWNFLQDEDYHLGVNIQAAAPTGNKRNGTFVMQPVVGNGNHWELGGGLGAHWVFWRSEDEEKHFGFYFSADLTHLFNATENRTFDLVGPGDNSRYMLATKFQTQITGGLLAASSLTAASADLTPVATQAPSAQFASIYAPVANISTLDVKVKIGVQADLVAMFNFSARGFSWDLGYNFWGRTCEDISCPTDCGDCGCPTICSEPNTWGLKGDARMFGFDGVTDVATALSATQSKATIHSGTNVGATSTVDALGNPTCRNLGVDNATFAYNATNRLICTPLSEGGLNIAANHIKTSLEPVLLKCCDVAFEQQETKGLSNTVFTHLSYTWWDRDNWVPFLGIGGSAEFGKSPSCCDATCTTVCDSSCDDCDCISAALSQWAVWVKGGVSFN